MPASLSEAFVINSARKSGFRKLFSTVSTEISVNYGFTANVGPLLGKIGKFYGILVALAVVDGLFLGVFVGDIVADTCQQIVPFFGDVIGNMGGCIEGFVPTWNLVENVFLDTADAFEHYFVCFCLGNMGVAQ